MKKEELKETTGGQAVSDEEAKIYEKLKKSVEYMKNGGKGSTLEEFKERQQKKYFEK